MKFAIEMNGTTALIAGFDEQHQVVQSCTDKALAKTFKNDSNAAKWASQFLKAGFGLESIKVVPL